MNKKYTILLFVAVLAIAGALTYFVSRSDSDSSQNQVQGREPKQLSLTFSELQANYPSSTDACLTTSDAADLAVDSSDRSAIESANLGTIIDIPAGTNVDVFVKTYDDSRATGTSIYESTYGSYNFTAQKVADPGSGGSHWVVSKFVACKK